MEGNRILFPRTSCLKTHNIVMGQVEVGRNWLCQFLPHTNFEENHQKVQLGTSLFCPEVSVHQPNQVKRTMANQLAVAVNPSLLGEGDGGKSNAAAAATAKRQKRDRKMELPKVSDNFSGGRGGSGAAKGEELRPRRALVRGRGAAVRSPGGATIPDDAGGTPRKKLAASFGEAKGTLANKTAGAGGCEESKAAADEAGGTPGGKQPPHGAGANATGPPKGVRADGAEDSKGEDPPAGTDLDPEVDKAEDNKFVEDDLFCLGNLLNGMRALQARTDKDGTTASRFAAQAGEPKDWVNEYKAFVTLTKEEEGRALEATLAPEASNRTYLAIVNEEGKFGVFHGLRRWTTGARGVNEGNIVVFKGEVWADHQAPYLWCFKEDDEDMFCLVALPDVSFGAAVKYYGHVANGNHFWKDVAPNPKTGNWIGQLIPVPIEWAPFFLGYPDLGTAFRRALELVASVEKAEQEKFRGLALRIMFACCSGANQKKVVSALSTHWKRLLHTKTSLAWAANAWQEGANPALPIMLPPSPWADMTPRDKIASFLRTGSKQKLLHQIIHIMNILHLIKNLALCQGPGPLPSRSAGLFRHRGMERPGRCIWQGRRKGQRRAARPWGTSGPSSR
jgi:hypothetical protein